MCIIDSMIREKTLRKEKKRKALTREAKNRTIYYIKN